MRASCTIALCWKICGNGEGLHLGLIELEFLIGDVAILHDIVLQILDLHVIVIEDSLQRLLFGYQFRILSFFLVESNSKLS